MAAHLQPTHGSYSDVLPLSVLYKFVSHVASLIDKKLAFLKKNHKQLISVIQ